MTKIGFSNIRTFYIDFIYKKHSLLAPGRGAVIKVLSYLETFLHVLFLGDIIKSVADEVFIFLYFLVRVGKHISFGKL